MVWQSAFLKVVPKLVSGYRVIRLLEINKGGKQTGRVMRLISLSSIFQMPKDKERVEGTASRIKAKL
eukprot:205109-Pelagomonas_calceolata.AAC.1